jgi:hypothetical protein
MQSGQMVLPYGCHFLDDTTNHIIGLRNMRGQGEMLAVRGESTPDCGIASNTQRLQRAPSPCRISTLGALILHCRREAD